MPHMTQAYPFERKVLAFAARLSATLSGEDGRTSFLMEFDDKGLARALRFERTGSRLQFFKNQLEDADGSYIFYDPFDAPEYIFMAWRQVNRATMERLVGAPFSSADFSRTQQAPQGVPDLEPSNEYPVSWHVMF